MRPAKRMHDRLHHEDSKYIHVDFKKDEKGKVHGKLLFPHDYVKVKSEHDLKDLLDHYGNSTVWFELIPPTTFARRAFVERVRPALRFYCEKYGVEVPKWLANDKQFEDMSPSRKKRLFGTDEINIVKWKKIEPPPMLPEKMQHDNGGVGA